MAELISLTPMPDSSSKDAIHSRPPVSLRLDACTSAVAGRAKSMSRLPSIPDSQDAAVVAGRGENCTVRANSTRKRSQSDVNHEGLIFPPISCLAQSDSGASQKPHGHNTNWSHTPDNNQRRSSPELGSLNSESESTPSREVYRSRIQDRGTSTHRTPSRGRARRRGTPHPAGTAVRTVEHSNISRRRKPLSEAQFLLTQRSGELSDKNSNAESSCKKRVLWVPNSRGPEVFCFPKSRNEQEPIWSPGDGFSDDEAQPEFMFLMTGRHKRKRSRSLSALGQLTLEPTDAATNDQTASTLRFFGIKRRQAMQSKENRSEVRDLWPTRENFAEDLSLGRIEGQTPEKHPTILPTPPNSVAIPQAKKLAVSRKRQPSAFWNFGRSKQRSQSRPITFTTSSSAMARQQYNERIDLPDEASEESEEQPMTDTEDSDSEWLGQEETDEQGDVDVDMQDTITCRELDDEIFEAAHHTSEGMIGLNLEDIASQNYPFLDHEDEDDRRTEDNDDDINIL